MSDTKYQHYNTYTEYPHYNTYMSPGYCGHCGYYHSGPCPRIKAIEYYSNGMVKRVEYHEPTTQVSTKIY